MVIRWVKMKVCDTSGQSSGTWSLHKLYCWLSFHEFVMETTVPNFPQLKLTRSFFPKIRKVLFRLDVTIFTACHGSSTGYYKYVIFCCNTTCITVFEERISSANYCICIRDWSYEIRKVVLYLDFSRENFLSIFLQFPKIMNIESILYILFMNPKPKLPTHLVFDRWLSVSYSQLKVQKYRNHI